MMEQKKRELWTAVALWFLVSFIAHGIFDVILRIFHLRHFVPLEQALSFALIRYLLEVKKRVSLRGFVQGKVSWVWKKKIRCVRAT